MLGLPVDDDWQRYAYVSSGNLIFYLALKISSLTFIMKPSAAELFWLL